MSPGREMPGTTGTPKADTAALAAILSPIVSIAATGGPMKVTPAASRSGCELCVLREESVARVNGLRTGAAHGVEDGIDRQVTLPGGRRSDPDRNVGHDDVPGIRVGIAEHRDRSNSHGPQRTDHPHRDFAAVGDQNGIEEL